MVDAEVVAMAPERREGQAHERAVDLESEVAGLRELGVDGGEEIGVKRLAEEGEVGGGGVRIRAETEECGRALRDGIGGGGEDVLADGFAGIRVERPEDVVVEDAGEDESGAAGRRYRKRRKK